MKQSAFVFALLILIRPAVGADNIVIADFEGADYKGWSTTGTAFGTGPVHGELPNQQKVDGYLGHGFVNSYLGGDQARGRLTSPEFTVDRPYISFLIGGGYHPRTTCINLLVSGKVVETATGADDEHLEWCTWDVKAWMGKQAKLQIVDTDTGQWGHINVDQIIQTDKPPVPPVGTEAIYQESLRPQFHFSSAANWINDPNGLVFYAGEYHLFFQHNPSGMNWGNMTWGHAVSPDLVHWTQLADALKPDALGTMFSGSAVVDWNNTSGFGSGTEKPLIAMYTAAGGTNPESRGRLFSQCIAWSNDKGRTWTKYSQNPVIAHIAGENRDPKVVWYEPDHRWIVALYKEGNTYALFSSPDLKKWTLLQDVILPGCSECPDFFPMPVEGDAAKTKWVFTAADGHYLVGSFDGSHFAPEQPVQQVDFGRNYYAVQTFSDIPKTDGRRIQLAWMRDGKYPRMPFNGQMSFPAEMTLKTTKEGLRIFRMPVREIESLQGPARKWTDLDLNPGENPLADLTGDLFHIRADLLVGSARTVGFKIRGQTVSYDVASHTLSALGEAPVQLENGHLHLEILIDRTSIETFANDGRVSFTSCFLPGRTDHPLEMFCDGGKANIAAMSVFPLKSAWPASAQPVEPK
jgi:sucrose-6-phosphate hydrolase SacC (GH32 family)